MVFGYDIGGAGGTFVMHGFEQHFGWYNSTNIQIVSDSRIALDKGLINGCFGVGAFLGALVNPVIADHFGRRPSLFVSAAVFVIGATIQILSPAGDSAFAVMWTGRAIGGFGIGMLSMLVPIYISECAPEHKRGLLGSLWQMATVTGILIASIANVGLEHVEWGWRISYGGNIPIAVLMGLLFLCLPESPRWLATKDKKEQLSDALALLRFEDEVEAETAELTAEVEEERHLGSASWVEIFSTANSMRYRVLLGCALQMFQQLSGINAVMFYAPEILKGFFDSTTSLYANLGLMSVNFIATFYCLYAIDKFGRAKLLFLGGLVMTLMLVGLIVLSAYNEANDNVKWVGWAVFSFAAIFVANFAYSWGPIIWVACGEMFPLRSRGKAVGLTTATNWICTTIVGAIFPIAKDASLTACFAFFACFIGCGTAVVYLFLPETANLTILQIDAVFNCHKPKCNRSGFCCSKAPDPDAKGSPHGGATNDTLALEHPIQVPSSRFSRHTGRYSYDSERTSSAHVMP